MTNAPLLVIEDLVAGYGEQTVLDGISITVRRGEIVAVLGGSGCGKSTLLRCIVGLLAPRSGTVHIDGRAMTGASRHEHEEILRHVGMSFQDAALLNSMSTAENVAFPIIEHLDVDYATAIMMARMKLAKVGLATAANKFPAELSGGMRKRAGVARALALDPPLVLFDEPSAGLDPITARGLDDLILTLGREGSMGLVVVTHEIASVRTIADRVIMLSGGVIAASGTLAEVEASPNPEVQAFFRREMLGGTDANNLLDAMETRE